VEVWNSSPVFALETEIGPEKPWGISICSDQALQESMTSIRSDSARKGRSNLGSDPIFLALIWGVSGAKAGYYPPAGANYSKSIERDKSAGEIMYGRADASGGTSIRLRASVFLRATVDIVPDIRCWC
jgi:hypothetical protein